MCCSTVRNVHRSAALMHDYYMPVYGCRAGTGWVCAWNVAGRVCSEVFGRVLTCGCRGPFCSQRHTGLAILQGLQVLLQLLGKQDCHCEVQQLEHRLCRVHILRHIENTGNRVAGCSSSRDLGLVNHMLHMLLCAARSCLTVSCWYLAGMQLHINEKPIF